MSIKVQTIRIGQMLLRKDAVLGIEIAGGRLLAEPAGSRWVLKVLLPGHSYDFAVLPRRPKP